MKLGDVVRSVFWESVADKYVAPRRFDDHAEAVRYSGAHGVLLLFTVTFDSGTASTTQESGESLGELIGPGDSVRRVAHRITRWIGYDGPLLFDDLESARAAAPDGRVTDISRILWVGPHRISMTAAERTSVDKTEGS